MSLARRAPLRLLLLELVRRRMASPGEPVPQAQLAAAGWPSEKLHPTAAKNRLAVSLTAMRKLGLRDLLVNDARGYYLDPTVSVLWSSDGGSTALRAPENRR